MKLLYKSIQNILKHCKMMTKKISKIKRNYKIVYAYN